MFASIRKRIIYGMRLEDDDFVDPLSEFANSGVNARLVGLCTADAP